MATVGSRLKEAREKAGYSQKQLAEDLGWPADAGQRRISYYEQAKSEPSYQDLAKIARQIGVNAAYLAFGDISERMPQALKDFGAPSARSDLVWISEYGNEQTEPNVCLTTTMLGGVSINADSASWLSLIDNNMEPVIPNGSIVVFDRSNTAIHSGQCYVVEHGGLVRVVLVYQLPKGAIRLKSYNESEWPDDVIRDADEEGFHIIGRVVWYSVKT